MEEAIRNTLAPESNEWQAFEMKKAYFKEFLLLSIIAHVVKYSGHAFGVTVIASVIMVEVCSSSFFISTSIGLATGMCGTIFQK